MVWYSFEVTTTHAVVNRRQSVYFILGTTIISFGYRYNMIIKFYAQPLFWVVIEVLFSTIIWALIISVFNKKIRKILCIVGTILSVCFVIYLTLLVRQRRVVDINLIPFSSFERAKVQSEMYRSMLMNVVLFVPLGLSLPYIFGGSTKKRILLTILLGFLFSMTVEAIQYFAFLGMAETDDVICNTLGTAIGSCGYLLSLLWHKLNIKTKGRRTHNE